MTPPDRPAPQPDECTGKSSGGSIGGHNDEGEGTEHHGSDAQRAKAAVSDGAAKCSDEPSTNNKREESETQGLRLPKRRKAAKGADALGLKHRDCPRCQSANTKFCYNNNYDESQPRYFCKARRPRAWVFRVPGQRAGAAVAHPL